MTFGGKYLRSLISKFILGKLTYQVKVRYLPIFSKNYITKTTHQNENSYIRKSSDTYSMYV